jgi:hypothetical protein
VVRIDGKLDALFYLKDLPVKNLIPDHE